MHKYHNVRVQSRRRCAHISQNTTARMKATMTQLENEHGGNSNEFGFFFSSSSLAAVITQTIAAFSQRRSRLSLLERHTYGQLQTALWSEQARGMRGSPSISVSQRAEHCIDVSVKPIRV